MCSGDLLEWKGHRAAGDASLSSHQRNSHTGCFLTSHPLAPVNMAACIFNNYWTFLCVKEYACCLLNCVLVFLKSVAHGELLWAATSVGA